MNTTLTYSRQPKVNPYLMNEILEASPQELLIKVYDAAIAACQRRDLYKTNKAISVLIEALNFQEPAAKEISIGLLGLYQFAQEKMRKKEYEIVLKILTELRETWSSVFEVVKQNPKG